MRGELSAFCLCTDAVMTCSDDRSDRVGRSFVEDGAIAGCMSEDERCVSAVRAKMGLKFSRN